MKTCRTFPATPLSTDIATEKHFSPAEAAELWRVSDDTIRRLFCSEEGVIIFGSPETRFKRKRETMRIPQSVLERVTAGFTAVEVRCCNT